MPTMGPAIAFTKVDSDALLGGPAKAGGLAWQVMPPSVLAGRDAFAATGGTMPSSGDSLGGGFGPTGAPAQLAEGLGKTAGAVLPSPAVAA